MANEESRETKSASSKKSAKFSPRAFLKARRPERFSDTTSVERPVLDRSILEYHLDTLTSRNQDVAFANFARHLAEREICPNLLPQTGPTGGGDSKVDSETYPVADSLALGWYTGVGRQAAAERWGFAFSAKKKWRSKISSDVDKAVQTNRGYAKVFFITNQFVRDKERAEVEDKSRKKHGIDVRILDRTWILDRVFTNGHEVLAMEDLLLAVPTRHETRQGPLDTQRTEDFKKVEQKIQEALRTEHFTPQLADDCLEAADLARQMERPRVEIDGLYERAEEIAAKYGTDYQRLQVAYQKAWTAYWWHEDYAQFDQLYDIIEQTVKGTKNANDLELLSNCWSLLHGAVLNGKLRESSSKHSARTDSLRRELTSLSNDEERPSTALHAKSLLLNMRLLLNIRNDHGIDDVLREFKELIQSCEGLVGFPFEPVVQILGEIGDQIGDRLAYDELFDAMIAAQTKRNNDVTAARMLLQRGEQQITAKQPYAAIRSLGLSLARLYKSETRRDAVYALYLCAFAYERVGLLWAARGTLLSAASLATQEFSEYGEITRAQAACYRQLKWLELQLGRVAHALAWHQVDIAVRGILADRGIAELDLEAEAAFDGCMGILLLKVDFWELKRLCFLPDILDNLGLFNASVALKYSLGYEDELRGSVFGAGESERDVYDYFLKWRDLPDGTHLAGTPAFYEEQHVALESLLLGCRILVDTENSSPCVELSESILAALESLLSTGTVEWMIAHQPLLTMAVRRADFLPQAFVFELHDETGRPHIDVGCSAFDPHTMARKLQEECKDTLFKVLTTVIGRIATAGNLPDLLMKLGRDELALDRSINFTGSFVSVANVLGRQPRTRISQWSVPGGREYAVRRDRAWDANDREEQKSPQPKTLTLGKGKPPSELSDWSQVKQHEMRTVSFIRESLWEKARWSGTMFASPVDESSPPILGIAFEDTEAGKQIFRFWRDELGVYDSEEKLRVAIVRGINTEEPYWYRVLIGSNPIAGLEGQEVRYAAFISKTSTMYARTDVHLERFLRTCQKINHYFLMPALFRGEAVNPELIYDRYLVKRKIHVRQAWEIGKNDPDSVAIHYDDKPIIPAGKVGAPVVELLRLKTKKSRAGLR